MKNDPAPPGSAWAVWRGALVVVAGVGTLWWLCFRFPIFWMATGMGEANRPFLDLYALLAGCDAVRQGLNPMLPNPLDPYNRPFGFSDWWFELARLGWGRKDTLWLGTTLAVATLVTAVAIVRPANRRERWALGLLLVSPALLLGIQRANQDLVVFLVVSLGLVCFRGSGWPVRALGIILFAAAAVLKYFPLVTLVVLLDFRTRRAVLASLALYFLVLLLAWPGLEASFKSVLQHPLAPEWLYAFGAPMLLRDFGVAGSLGWLVPAGLMAAWAIREAWPHLQAGPVDPAGRMSPAEREFICGAAMLVGVFFLGASYIYKLVFAVWLLPWLGRAGSFGEARWARITGRLLFAVAWLEGVMAVGLNVLVGSWSRPVAEGLLKGTLVITQLLTWALVACLLRFVLIHVARRGRILLAAPG